MDVTRPDDQLLEAARAAKSAEELEGICREDGEELSEDALTGIDGGTWQRLKLRCKDKLRVNVEP